MKKPAILLMLILNLYSSNFTFGMEAPEDQNDKKLKLFKKSEEILDLFFELLPKEKNHESLLEYVNKIFPYILEDNFFKEFEKGIHLVRMIIQQLFSNNIATFNFELFRGVIQAEKDCFIDYILSGYDVNWVIKASSSNFTPAYQAKEPILFKALQIKDINLIKLLIIFGVELNVKKEIKTQTEEKTETPLIYCQTHKLKEIEKLLLIMQ